LKGDNEMKGKLFVTAVLAMVGLTLLLNGRPAQASHNTFLAINDIYLALNAGEVDTALASFAEDATAENRVRAETYRGVSQIRQMLQEMQRDGRQFDIVDVDMNGNTITANVEVMDSGYVWGTETVEAVVKGDKLQSFKVVAFRLELWRIGR
jgi:limonene-1,2-epoxide hydrolase